MSTLELAPPTSHRAPEPSPLAYEIVRSLIPARVGNRVLKLLPLSSILTLQALLSLRLPSTAWGDEGLYAFAGHREIAHIMHGVDISSYHFPLYFSGAPWAYPVISGMLDDVGGLRLVRAFSCLCMLITTAMVYLVGHRLVGKRPALLGALIFALAAPTIFLGNFATYDALCLCLLATAYWLALCRQSIFSSVLVGLLMTAAIVVKYAGALWVPFILATMLVLAWPEGRARAMLRTAIASLTVLLLLVTALLSFAHNLWAGVERTTTNRVILLPSSRADIAGQILADVGFTVALSLVGLVLYLRLSRQWLLGVILVAGALVAPLHQLQIHERTALHKHVDFGLIFIAPFAGYLLSRWSQRGVGRAIATGTVFALFIYCCQHSRFLYTRSNISPAVISQVNQILDGVQGSQHLPVASSDPDVFMYYNDRPVGTFDWSYGTVDAINHGSYAAIVESNNVLPGLRSTTAITLINAALANSRKYRLVLVTPLRPGYTRLKWYVFVRVQPGGVK